MNTKPEILFEDNHLLVAVKPPGVLSQPGNKKLPDMLTVLKEYLKEKYDKPGNVFLGLVHRLDLNVGGVMVFARTSKAASRLFEEIKDKRFEKHYLAVVEGDLKMGSQAALEDNLVKDEKERVAHVAKSGQFSRLVYTVIVNRGGKSLLEIRLESGRFHQIRAQLASRGYPITGDAKYGAKGLLPDNRIALWAYYLAFEHPITKEKMVFRTYPSDGGFQRFVDCFDDL